MMKFANTRIGHFTQPKNKGGGNNCSIAWKLYCCFLPASSSKFLWQESGIDRLSETLHIWMSGSLIHCRALAPPRVVLVLCRNILRRGSSWKYAELSERDPRPCNRGHQQISICTTTTEPCCH